MNVPHSLIASEYQVDAILLSGESDDWLNLSWSNRERKIIVFSDENLQFSAASQFFNIQEALLAMTSSCSANDYSVSAFVEFQWPTNPDWLTLTSSCNGYLEYLAYDPITMIDKLNYWFGEEC